MKVVIATHGFLPNIGGVSTNVSILARGFTDKGHRTTVVTLNDGPVDGYGYEVVRRPNPAKLFELYLAADLLILSNLALRLVYPLLFIPRRFALRHHSESAFQLGYSPPDLVRRNIRARAVHFMTSQFVGRRSGLPHYAVTPPFANTHHITEAVVRPIGERADAIFVGRLEPEKGIMWLGERWGRAREILGVDKLRIVGSGSLLEEIKAKAASCEWQNVEVVGPQQRAETAQAMGRAAFIFVPSIWEEPFGAVALEGLAAGAVAIVSDRGGLREAGSSLALYYDPDSDEQFYDAVGRARMSFDAQAAEPLRREKYLAEVNSHVSKFTPGRVVNTILAEMGLSP